MNDKVKDTEFVHFFTSSMYESTTDMFFKLTQARQTRGTFLYPHKLKNPYKSYYLSSVFRLFSIEVEMEI